VHTYAYTLARVPSFHASRSNLCSLITKLTQFFSIVAKFAAPPNFSDSNVNGKPSSSRPMHSYPLASLTNHGAPRWWCHGLR
jgi:hypothetical protein